MVNSIGGDKGLEGAAATPKFSGCKFIFINLFILFAKTMLPTHWTRLKV